MGDRISYGARTSGVNVSLDGVRTALDVDKGMALLQRGVAVDGG